MCGGVFLEEWVPIDRRSGSRAPTPLKNTIMLVKVKMLEVM